MLSRSDTPPAIKLRGFSADRAGCYPRLVRLSLPAKGRKSRHVEVSPRSALSTFRRCCLGHVRRLGRRTGRYVRPTRISKSIVRTGVAATFPGEPMIRDITYSNRGRTVPARQFYVERGMDRFSVTVADFHATGRHRRTIVEDAAVAYPVSAAKSGSVS